MKSVFEKELNLSGELNLSEFEVLKGNAYDGEETVDAIVYGKTCRIAFETKIKSGTLRKEQIEKHLKSSCASPESHKRLVLLTPDDSKSEYVKQFVEVNKEVILHLEWRRLLKRLDEWRKSTTNGVLTELVKQFLDSIRERIFSQDIAGIVAKVTFGEKSGVNNDNYLDEMRAGKWTRWNTPKQYKYLDGTGRKLLLYDKVRKGITVEVEIDKVEHTNAEEHYPWTNTFAGRPTVFERSIPIEHIEAIERFKTFGRNRGAFQKLTQEEYRSLLEGAT